MKNNIMKKLYFSSIGWRMNGNASFVQWCENNMAHQRITLTHDTYTTHKPKIK